jgi:hypothetical protein
MKPFSMVFIVMALLTGCSRAAAQGIDFDRDVAPILRKRCGRCHGEDRQKSGLRLDRRADMLRGGDSGSPAVVAGKPERSLLIQVVSHREPDLKMPPKGGKIPAAEIDLLTRWIQEGARWSDQANEADEKQVGHWSFQPIVRPEVRGVSEGSMQPIDAFLLRRLAKHDLTFSELTDPRSLLRRVSIVLTGLAPTPTEAADFLAAYSKDSEAAYAALVDRLLDSPHFGERWAQHWLDVIRWAETNGSESNMYRKNAWIYRDYVIRAFSDDKPYDQFLFDQIAGDTAGQGEATGYLVSGPHVPVATVGQEPAARRQARADRMDEILQTVGASALGMTIGCARCHNHKFDPISIRDYYSMSAVFQDIEFGSRFPELAEDHPRRVRGKELYARISEFHEELQRMGPWEENWTGYRELHFSPARAKAVRVTFQWNSARIDELEIFGPEERRKNLALASEGTVAHSPKEMAVVRSELRKINDGRYGTEAWASRAPKGSKTKPWVQLTFTEPHDIERIRLSTNREDFLETDYLEGLNRFSFGPYRVEVHRGDGEWKIVAATMSFEKLNRKHKSRASTLQRLQELIQLASDEGPKPSFVARFIKPVKTRIFHRGSPENPRDEVHPAALTEIDGDLKLEPDAPGKQRRKAFALWLTSPTHPLTARVAANRLWHHVFGSGIVTTTSDFGAAGAPPTHPELLDWLAAELKHPSSSLRRAKTADWSIKHLIRLMVLSRAFRQSSQPRSEGLAVDAGSALLWRYPPKRMEAEVLRDSILRASDSLDLKVGGRSYRIHNVKKRYAQWQVIDNHGAHTWRRMIYQERMRRVDDRMFTAFDFPDCGQVRAKRPVSTTPLQALNLMNSDFVIQQSKRIAERAERDSGGDDRKSIDRCFELLLGRTPDDEERKACLSLAIESDLSLVCRALINSNEFTFIP